MDRLQEILNRWSAGSTAASDLGLGPFLLLLLLSVAAAVIISYLYLNFYAHRSTGSQIHRSFPLLALAVTAIFIAIQFSLPLSLGLLGALSIVRFRTPIKAPEEIAFIMLVVATSLACATFNILFLVGILAVALATLVLARWAPALVPLGPTQDGSILITLAEADYEAQGKAMLQRLEDRLKRGRLESISRNEDEVALSLSFRAMPTSALVSLEAELRELAKPRHLTVLYSRPEAL